MGGRAFGPQEGAPSAAQEGGPSARRLSALRAQELLLFAAGFGFALHGQDQVGERNADCI